MFSDCPATIGLSEEYMRLVIDIIVSLMCLYASVYMLLIAYHVVPLNMKDPEIWHRKYDKIMKILGVIGIIAFIVQWITSPYITYFEGK